MTKTIGVANFIVIGGGGLLKDEFNIKTVPRYLFPAHIGKIPKKGHIYVLRNQIFYTFYARYLSGFTKYWKIIQKYWK